MPKVDEISKTPMAGVYEVRIGADVFFYTDENGSYLVEAHLIDPKTRVDLTEQRIAKLTAIDFKTLPLKDAMVWKQGTGERKLVVFATRTAATARSSRRTCRRSRMSPSTPSSTRSSAAIRRRCRSRSGAPRTTPRPGATG
jgi:hypothetical protein